MISIDHIIDKYNDDLDKKNLNSEKMNLDKILKVLDDDKHEDILHLTRSKIKNLNNKILQQLGLSGNDIKIFHKKLEKYRYVNDLINLKEGSFIRWISLSNVINNKIIKLTNGGFVLSVKIFDSGLQILCKNAQNIKFQIKFDEVIIFQKISLQESLLIDIVEYLHK